MASRTDAATRGIEGTLPGAARTDSSDTASLPLDWVPVALLALLLLTATWFNGAFAVRHWAPGAVLALTMLAAAVTTGAPRVLGRWERVAVAAFWGYAGWTLLSALWAESPGRAVEGSSRVFLYAALFTTAVAVVASRRSAERLGGGLLAGVGAIAAVTLVRLLIDGEELFLAGRLDDPVGYRNATACLFAFGFWPFIAAAAHRGVPPFLRAASFGGAALVLGLAFLTQARGVLLGLALGGLVALAFGPDRLRRAWLLLVVVGLMAGFSDSLLSPYRLFSDTGQEAGAAEIGAAADALLALVVMASAIGLVVALLDGGLRIDDRIRAWTRRFGAAALALVAVAAAVGSLSVIGNPVDFVEERFDEFRELETAAPGKTRLTFGGGQRSDLWRIALSEFSDRPLTGVGEGSYSFGYYQDRRTDRNVSTPHSLPFSILAETGLVGVLLFGAFLITLAVAFTIRFRRADARARWWASGLVAGGVVVLVQASVDWLWLIPGTIALGLLAFGLSLVLLRPLGPASPRRPTPVAGRATAAVALGLLALLTGSLYLGDFFVRKARSTGPDAPQERLDAARSAGRLNPWGIQPLYLQAGALEDLGRQDDARRRLRDALQRERHNFVTFGLLGDLEARAGNASRARRYYRRALELNPRDVGLRQLSRRGLD